MYARRIDEHVVPGLRLGRHIRHDPRSLRYLVPERDPAGLVSVRHRRWIPVLDQGDLGSCTGNAAEGLLGTSPFFEALAGNPNTPTDDADVDEDQAVALYSAATRLDDYDGAYPPDDTGSDGLSVAKACQQAGLISGYQHAVSLNAALSALAVRPLITGTYWYSSFDEPANDGLIQIKRGASVRGGHEYELEELDIDNRLVWFTNSWTAQWGVNGRACMTWDTFGRLLSEDGDVTDFVPLTSPVPTPTPDPDEELAGCLTKLLPVAQRWLAQRSQKGQ